MKPRKTKELQELINKYENYYLWMNDSGKMELYFWNGKNIFTDDNESIILRD